MISPQHITIDLWECTNPKAMKNEQCIKDFVEMLCSHLKLTRVGDTITKLFVDPEDTERTGVTALQILGESSIDIHTYNETNAVYISIFSCSTFDVKKAINISQTYFGAKDGKVNNVKRMRLLSNHSNHFT